MASDLFDNNVAALTRPTQPLSLVTFTACCLKKKKKNMAQVLFL